MGFFRKNKPDTTSRHDKPDSFDKGQGDPRYNAKRDEHLFWHTPEGYIIAQDILCQSEYVENHPCPACGNELRIVAHLNRGGQGLSELVTVCVNCRYSLNFIFDISNDVYQQWWAEQTGDTYFRQFDGEPRRPDSPPD